MAEARESGDIGDACPAVVAERALPADRSAQAAFHCAPWRHGDALAAALAAALAVDAVGNGRDIIRPTTAAVAGR